MLPDIQTSRKVLTDVFHVEQRFRITNPLTCNTETAISVIDGAGDTVQRKTDLMGTLGVEIRMG